MVSPHAVAYVVELDGHPIGFLFGVVQPTAHARFVRRRCGRRLAVLGVLGLLAHPRAAARFVRTRVGRYLRAWRRTPAPPTPRTDEPVVLSHVAVEPGARGAGAGRLLVQQFADAARDAGAREARLLTVAADDGARAFYRQLGWELIGGRPATRDAPAMDEMAFDLRFGR